MNCVICKRTLKNPTLSGMGKICAMKNRLGETTSAKMVIELIYDNKRGNRNYLIRTVDRVKIFVSVNHRIVKCYYCSHGKCEHLDIIEQADRVRFPAEYAEMAEH